MSKASKLAVAGAAVLSTLLFLTAGPAAAASDNFSVGTDHRNPCIGSAGVVKFIDNGDDIEIFDMCENDDGVKAWAWLEGRCLDPCGGKYNGKGIGGRVDWDPFPNGNVRDGQKVGLKVCSVDGSSDPRPYDCASKERVIHE